MTSTTRRGPRGSGDTRTAILDAARALFSVNGFRRTTLRSIAAEADVDVALVSYWFGSKEALFREALDVPINPAELIGDALLGDPKSAGERVVRRYLMLWEQEPTASSMRTLFRTALADEDMAETLREFITHGVVKRVAKQLAQPDAQRRAALAGSQLVGIAILRYIVQLEALAEPELDEVVSHVAPTVQRYLFGDLD